jgi:hypothetical protein
VVHDGAVKVETTYGEYARKAKGVEGTKAYTQETLIELGIKPTVLGILTSGDFFGELAILMPHAPKGIERLRTVYRDPIESRERFVELHCLSYDDVAELERLRPPIKHMLKPYKRQAIAARYASESSFGAGVGSVSSARETHTRTSSGGGKHLPMLDIVDADIAPLRKQMTTMQRKLDQVLELLHESKTP